MKSCVSSESRSASAGAVQPAREALATTTRCGMWEARGTAYPRREGRGGLHTAGLELESLARTGQWARPAHEFAPHKNIPADLHTIHGNTRTCAAEVRSSLSTHCHQQSDGKGGEGICVVEAEVPVGCVVAEMPFLQECCEVVSIRSSSRASRLGCIMPLQGSFPDAWGNWPSTECMR